MSEANIEIRVVFADAGPRDRIRSFLLAFDVEKAEANGFAAEKKCLLSIGLDPQLVFGSTLSHYIAITHARPLGERGLEFRVWGGVNSAADFAASFLRALRVLGLKEIIYASLNNQVMEIAVYYWDQAREFSYETGFDGDADEAIWEAEYEGTLLDTVRELARNSQLLMPVLD